MASERSDKLLKQISGAKEGSDSSSDERPLTDPEEILARILQRNRPEEEAAPSEDVSYDCQDCKDRGSHTVIENGMRYVRLCHCRERKRSEIQFRKAEIPFEYWDLQLPITDRVLTIAHVDPKRGDERSIDINRFLGQYLKQLDEKIKSRCNLLLCGNHGSGKTFVSMIIAREAVLRGHSCFYVTMSKYLDLRRRFNDDQAIAKADEMMDADVLVLDDVGKEFYSEKGTWVYSRIEDLIRYRFSKEAITILTSNFNLFAEDEEHKKHVREVDSVARVHISSIQSLLKSYALCLELIIDEDYRQEMVTKLWDSFDLDAMEAY